MIGAGKKAGGGKKASAGKKAGPGIKKPEREQEEEDEKEGEAQDAGVSDPTTDDLSEMEEGFSQMSIDMPFQKDDEVETRTGTKHNPISLDSSPFRPKSLRNVTLRKKARKVAKVRKNDL